MSDNALVGLFITKRSVFDRYSGTLPEHLLEGETKTVIEDIAAWYDKNPTAEDIVPKDIDEFWEFVRLVRHPQWAHDKLTAFKELLKQAIIAAGSSTAADILKSLVLRDHAGRIAEKCDRFSAGDTSFPLFAELMDDVEEAEKEAGIHNQHSHEVTADIHEIMNHLTNLTTGLHWRSPNIESALGAIRKGDFVMLAGFVDSGKSTLAAQEITYMATQLPAGKKAIYFNNEEEGKKVKGRLIQSAIGWKLEDIDRNRDLAMRNYTAQMGGDPDKIIVVDSEKTPITPGLIRKKLREYDVGLMVFDQMYKIRGFKRYGDDKLGQLQDIFEYGRQLAKQYCPVIAVHQARGDANGLTKVEMHQLAGSQQAVQGELDAIVTIGRDLNMPHMRYLYVPKNKLPTPGDPSLRHGFFEVSPNFDIGRFDD